MKLTLKQKTERLYEKNPVNWFEIPVSNLGRAKKFYETVFGCKLDMVEMDQTKMLLFPMEDNSYGAGGALVQAEGYTPSYEGSLVYFQVENINETLKNVNANKGKTLMPKTSIGEYGFIAHFADSEGNKVALHNMT